MVEHVDQRELPTAAAELGAQRERQERVPAEREEVVVKTDRVEPEQVRPHPCDRALGFGSRLGPLGAWS